MFAFTTPIFDTLPTTEGRLSLAKIGSDTSDREVVRLKPDWMTILSMSRFAERATWLFGNGSGVVECIDETPGSCVTPRPSGDATNLRLDFNGWKTALMRPAGRARRIQFFDTHGFPIAAVNLENCDASVDQFIWLLADDEMLPSVPDRGSRADRYHPATEHVRSILPALERREDFERLVASYRLKRTEAFEMAGPFVATPLRSDAMALALALATEAGIRLRVSLENIGGGFTWSPASLKLNDAGNYLQLRSAFGRMHLDRRTGPAWMVHLTANDGAGPSLETESAHDGGSIRIDASDDLDRPTWRLLCRFIVSETAANAR